MTPENLYKIKRVSDPQVSPDGKSFTFVSEQIENGPPGLRAKLMFDILDDDDLRVSFHLAFPGREFDCYSVNTLKRKR